MTGPKVLVVGSINVDITLLVDSLPKPGETLLSQDSATALGGKGANQAVAAAATGVSVDFIGAVGPDEAGVLARENLKNRGIGVTGVANSKGSRTGTAYILVEAAGENIIIVDSGANTEVTLNRVESANLDANVLLTQFEIPYATVAALGARKGTATYIVNPAPMPSDPRQVLPAIAAADLLVPNRTELAQLAGVPVPTNATEVHQAAQTLAFPGTLVVTLGADGVMIFGPGGETVIAEIAAEPVAVVDTSGAGDVFCGVLAARLAQSVDLIDAVKQASKAASISTTLPGAQLPPDFQIV